MGQNNSQNQVQQLNHINQANIKNQINQMETSPYSRASSKITVGTALLSSAFTYTALTWGPRSRLDDAAAHINRKYSNIIARSLNYEGIIQ